MDKGAHERPFVVLSALWKQLSNFNPKQHSFF